MKIYSHMKYKYVPMLINILLIYLRLKSKVIIVHCEYFLKYSESKEFAILSCALPAFYQNKV